MNLVIYCLISIDFILSFHVGSQGLRDPYVYGQNISIYNSYKPVLKKQETKSQGVNKRIKKFALCRSYGVRAWHQSYKTHQHGSNFYEILDTTSQDDVVKNQYSSLPYPPVSEHQMELEKIHYMSNYSKQYPFDMYAPITLENMNHFLFNGNSSFRWASLNLEKSIYRTNICSY